MGRETKWLESSSRFSATRRSALLGGSSTPLDAYVWDEPSNPRADGDTIIVPAWSLRVNVDGSFRPVMPDSIIFREGEAIRPVCPFVELHALGEPGSGQNTWREAPLTSDLLSRLRGILAKNRCSRLCVKNR